MKKGTVGIMPPGALGVSFYYHLTNRLQRQDSSVMFIGLEGSRSIEALLAGDLRILTDSTVHHLPAEKVTYRHLQDAWRAGAMPEILLVCTNPDQLLQVIATIVTLIEQISVSQGGELDPTEVPVIILSSNGIYFQRVRQMFIEKLEESTLLGRLPDLWPDHMPQLVGKLLRGVTIQTGLRQGSGAEAIYRPGPRGVTVLSGGSEQNRQRCHDLLTEMGGWYELAPQDTPTRLEFRKAVINLIGNLLGLIHAFDDEGGFHPLTVGDILSEEHAREVRELAVHVLAVGQAVKAFGPKDNVEDILEQTHARCGAIFSHMPSSLQAMEWQIKRGTLKAEFPPTESWLIGPLIHYARSAGLEEAALYFEGLREALVRKLEKAVARLPES